MLSEFKKIIGFDQKEKIVLGFTKKPRKEFSIASPVLLSQSLSSKPPKSSAAGRGIVITPWNFSTPRSEGVGRLFAQIGIARSSVTVAGEDAIFNHAKIESVDVAEESKLLSVPTGDIMKTVYEDKLRVVHFNNLKVAGDGLSFMARAYSNCVYGLLHILSLRRQALPAQARHLFPKDIQYIYKMSPFASGKWITNKLVYQTVWLIAMDMTYCIPLYPAGEGIMLCFIVCVSDGSNIYKPLQFAIFLTNVKEGLFVLDGERCISNTRQNHGSIPKLIHDVKKAIRLTSLPAYRTRSGNGKEGRSKTMGVEKGFTQSRFVSAKIPIRPDPARKSHSLIRPMKFYTSATTTSTSAAKVLLEYATDRPEVVTEESPFKPFTLKLSGVNIQPDPVAQDQPQKVKARKVLSAMDNPVDAPEVPQKKKVRPAIRIKNLKVPDPERR